ncbi:MAG: TIGR00725 family protein [Candidatus Omnitrophota bacterium]|nr:TIGR00725 family protein [Candidatus Omnitrophota bacterium]
MYIAVIGGHNCSREINKIAEQVGYEIGRMGAVLVCGGLGGVMEAAARGSKKAKGKTIGILPGNNKTDANPYIDLPIVTGLGYARNSLVVKNADLVVAIDGKEGTLSEIAFSLQMKKPIIGIQTWDIAGIIKAKSVKQAVEKINEIRKRRFRQ